MQQAIITTIITTFHRPKTLEKAIRSVLAQTVPFFKVSVFDNGSDHETYNLMHGLMKEDARIDYHRHPSNIGMMANYQYAFSKIVTPFFSFLSDDDFLSPWFYESALRDLEKYPDAAFTCCSARVINAEGSELFRSLIQWNKTGYFSPSEGFLELLLPTFKPPAPVCTLFRHAIVRDIHFEWDEKIKILWDPCFLIKIAAHYPYVINPTICGFYLAHEEGFSTGFHKHAQSLQGITAYAQAVSKLFAIIFKNNPLKKDIQSKAQNGLRQYFRNDFKSKIRHLMNKRKIKDAILSLCIVMWYLRIKPKLTDDAFLSKK
jgi:glycosyltransferase involved in cell wall biosynthesis